MKEVNVHGCPSEGDFSASSFSKGGIGKTIDSTAFLSVSLSFSLTLLEWTPCPETGNVGRTPELVVVPLSEGCRDLVCRGEEVPEDATLLCLDRFRFSGEKSTPTFGAR